MNYSGFPMLFKKNVQAVFLLLFYFFIYFITKSQSFQLISISPKLRLATEYRQLSINTQLNKILGEIYVLISKLWRSLSWAYTANCLGLLDNLAVCFVG